MVWAGAIKEAEDKMSDIFEELGADKDGWIKHDGRGMPVDGETLVLVRFRDASCELLKPHRASVWHEKDNPELDLWISDDTFGTDIVAYKIIPSKAP